MRSFTLLLACAVFLIACKAETGPPPVCKSVSFDTLPFTVCSAAPGSDIRLFHTAPDGKIYGQFDRLAEQVSADGSNLLFAMNGGMYHGDRKPVGLYLDPSGELTDLQIGESPGNFGMVPNGVFVIGGGAGNGAVFETEAYSEAEFRTPPSYATQSGPMLVIDGELHPKFNANGPSKKRRNGVGVSEDGTVHFAISDVPVNFHTFARLFRDELNAPNALYMDGVVSKLYSEELGRNEKGLDMGPIVGVVTHGED